MSRLDGAVWAGVERRLAAVERYIPEAPPWIATADGELVRTGVRAGPAWSRGSAAPSSARRRFVLILSVLALLLALLAAVLVAGTAPPSIDRLGEPFGPHGLYRSSDGGSSAVVLPDGRVLIVSGDWIDMGEEVAPLATLWDPTGRTATLQTRIGRVGATATLLLDGRVLVTGGFGGPFAYGSSAVSTAETWDPRTGTFASTGSMTRARVNHTATLLADGRVLVVGGVGPEGDTATAELWDPASSTFQPAGAFVGMGGGDTATLLETGDVLIAADGRAEIWRLATASFERAPGFTSVPGISTTATALLDGRILFIEGSDSPALPRAFIFTHGQPLRPVGSFLEPRSGHAATLLPDGRVLISGGQSDVEQELRSAEVWDPRDGSFRIAPPLDRAVSGHTALLLPDGRVLIVFDVVGPNGSDPPFVYDPTQSLE